MDAFGIVPPLGWRQAAGIALRIDVGKQEYAFLIQVLGDGRDQRVGHGRSCMRDDRLSHDEIKFSSEHGAIKPVIVVELRAFDPNGTLTEFEGNAILDQPAIGIDPCIVPGPEERYCEAPQSQGSASNIEQRMRVAQPKLEQQRELRRAHDVEPFRRPHVSSVVGGAGGKVVSFLSRYLAGSVASAAKALETSYPLPSRMVGIL